jgi:ABC-type branched-subunit amino acid transport system ATPase component
MRNRSGAGLSQPNRAQVHNLTVNYGVITGADQFVGARGYRLIGANGAGRPQRAPSGLQRASSGTISWANRSRILPPHQIVQRVSPSA